MNWRARLMGERFDLSALERLFNSNDPNVSVTDPGEYFLCSSELEATEANPLLPIAEGFISKMNGIARIQDVSYRPVSLDGRFLAEDGSVVILASVAIDIRSEMTAEAQVLDADGNVIPAGPLPQRTWLALSHIDADVQEVLELLNNVDLDWIVLFKVFEIVRDDAGGEKAIRTRGWANGSDISAFRAGANRPDASGTAARHARISGSPSARSLNIGEGRIFISGLVRSWIETKAKAELP